MPQRYVAYREVWITVDYEDYRRVEPCVFTGYGWSQEEAQQDADKQAINAELRDLSRQRAALKKANGD